MLTALSVPIVKLIGLQGTLLRLKSHLPSAPIFFFRLPQGDTAKKRKKRGATGQNMFYPSKEQKGVILGLMRIDHSAKQKTQAIYPDILLVF